VRDCTGCSPPAAKQDVYFLNPPDGGGFFIDYLAHSFIKNMIFLCKTPLIPSILKSDKFVSE